MTVEEFNNLDLDAARARFDECCGSSAWVECMLTLRPFQQRSTIFLYANVFWTKTNSHDWLEAIAGNHKISKNLELDSENPVMLQIELQLDTYLKKFGFQFIMNDQKLSPESMLQELNSRMSNSRDDELKVACTEQERITRNRLESLFMS